MFPSTYFFFGRPFPARFSCVFRKRQKTTKRNRENGAQSSFPLPQVRNLPAFKREQVFLRTFLMSFPPPPPLISLSSCILPFFFFPLPSAAMSGAVGLKAHTHICLPPPLFPIRRSSTVVARCTHSVCTVWRRTYVKGKDEGGWLKEEEATTLTDAGKERQREREQRRRRRGGKATNTLLLLFLSCRRTRFLGVGAQEIIIRNVIALAAKERMC